LCATDNNLVFVARRNFRVRRHHTPFTSIRDVQLQNRILLNQFRVITDAGTSSFDLFKERSGATREIVDLLISATRYTVQSGGTARASRLIQTPR
jgi:hypothetical protein